MFVEEGFKGDSEKINEAINVLGEAYGKVPDVEFMEIEDREWIEAGKKISSLIRDLKENNDEISIDITPGRKTLVVPALISGDQKVDNIFYLSIKSIKNASKPYMIIPREHQEIINFSKPEGSS